VTTKQQWWYVYGYFSIGENNLPHLGEVIRYYRKLLGIDKRELANILGCTKRYIEMLESDQNTTMPELISRRILLAKVLQIPPALLGLSSVVMDDETETTPSTPLLLGEETMMKPQNIAFYETMLTLSWEFYYTSSIERAATNIDFCFEMLNKEATTATGIQKDQYDAIRCRFYRLAALIARERMDIDKAATLIDEAVSLATRLKNAELIAASIIGRIRIRYHQKQQEQALQDAQRICFYADNDLLRDPLKGKCYQMAGEAQAYLAGNDRALQDKSLVYFDKARRTARTGNLAPDGSFVKTDLTSISIERAKALRLFRRFNEAHNAFAIARKNLSPELTRWQVNLLIEEAKTYFEEGDITSCCVLLLDALPIVRAIHIFNRETPICNLLEKCKQQEPYNTTVERLEKVFLEKMLIPAPIAPLR
jgi:transcriptional regulator with XRE-family HTH domain